MGKLFMIVVLALVGVAVYYSWPDIRQAMAPRQDSGNDKVVEGLKKMDGVFSGKNDPYYHCRVRCPKRIGGTRSPLARQKADALGMTPCSHCCEDR